MGFELLDEYVELYVFIRIMWHKVNFFVDCLNSVFLLDKLPNQG